MTPPLAVQTSTRARTLYDIEQDLLCSLDTILMLDQPEDAELRAELELQICHDIAAQQKKVDSVCRMFAHFESQAALAAEEIKRLTARKRNFEASIEHLEYCCRRALAIADKKRLDGTTSALVLQLNPESVYVLDASQIPAEYKTVEITETVNKNAVKAAIKAGTEVPGAELVRGDRLVRK